MSNENGTRGGRFRPSAERLDDRVMPALFGVPWADPTHLTLSFAPDGTPAAGGTSALFAALEPAVSREAWQGAILRAAQTWAQLANVSIGVVPDSGAAFGTAAPPQGSPLFGDIRIGGVPMSGSELAVAVPPDPYFSGSLAGDIFLNTTAALTPSALYSVALHELGHALGLAPSADPTSVMFNSFDPARAPAGPSAADVAALRALYGTRGADPNEGKEGNATFRTATRIRYSQESGGYDGSTPLAVYGDITARADVDTFWVKPLVGYTGPITFRLQTAGVSLLAAKLSVYDDAGRLLGSTTGSAGGVLTFTVPRTVADQKVYARVEAAPGTAFAVGRYGLGVTFDGLLKPTPVSLETVLRGPYEALDNDDVFDLFRDPDGALHADDLHTDDSFALATNLLNTPGYATGTNYRFTGGISDALDADVYRLRAPDAGSAWVLTATVRTIGTNGVTPTVEVFDGNMVSIRAAVIANGNGTFSVQATGLAAKKSYFLRVTAPGATGNYALEAQFGTRAARAATFAAETLPAGATEARYALYVGRSQLFGLGLEAPGGPVRVSITNAAGVAVAELTAPAGGTVTGLSSLLAPGEYTVRVARAGAGTGPVGFRLFGSSLTDPIGPVASDPTLKPQYQNPQDVTSYLYPNGEVTLDPYLWLLKVFS